MGKKTSRLTLQERFKIQTLLDEGHSYSAIAARLGRSTSTVSREVRNHLCIPGERTQPCIHRRYCERRNVCGTCPDSVRGSCAACGQGCTENCPDYRCRAGCPRMEMRRGLCNGCPELARGCDHPMRRHYDAAKAHLASREAASASRSFPRFSADEQLRICTAIRSCLARDLSPAQMKATCSENEIPICTSTIYEWIDRGYCDLMNIQLQDKTKRKPKGQPRPSRPTSHSERRSHANFSKLPEQVREDAWEMDTVVGGKTAGKCLLTLFHRRTRLQIVVLMPDRTSASVKRALEHVVGCCPAPLARRLFRTVLTDNGSEFSDEEGIARIFGEGPGGRPRLFYCDTRRSEQKGGCERNHRELRRILDGEDPSFDELSAWQVANAASHLNSRPRPVLGNRSPIEVFLTRYGKQAAEFLDALGIEQVPPHELVNNPSAING